MLKNSLIKTALFFWHLHRKLFISLIVLLAAVLIILRSLAFYLEAYPQVVKNFVEEHLHSQVTFEKIKVNVNPFFPSVSMQNFAIENNTGREKNLEFTSASIQLNIPLSIFRGQIIIDTLSLEGSRVLVQRNSNGEIFMAELQLTKAQKEPGHSEKNNPSYMTFLNQTNLIITDSKILFVDEMHDYPTVFLTDINFKMKNVDERHQLSLQAKLNESDASMDIRLDFTGRLNDIKNWDGEVYGAVENLDQQSIQQFLEEDVIQIENFQINNIETGVKVWSAIENGNLQSIHGELFADDARLTRVDRQQSIRFDQLTTNFKIQRGSHMISDPDQQESSWIIDLYDLNLYVDSKPISEKYINLKYQKDKTDQLPRVQVFLNEFDLHEFSHVISFFLPKKVSKQIYSIFKPRGRVENIVATMKLQSLDMPIDILSYQVQADIKAFAINSFQSIPKVRNFSAHVVFNETMGRINIDSHDMKLHLKSLFRDTWPITQLNGELYWQKEGTDWLFGADNLHLINPHLSANADLKLWLADNGQMLMDLTGYYHDANVKYVPYYLPVTTMSDGLVKWLDESILSGWGTDGGVVFRGNLSQFPYKDSNGAMDIVFNTSDVVLEFQKDWPKLTDISAQVQFTEQGMGVESHHSKIFSAVSSNVKVDIERYLKPVLHITGDIKSSADDGVQFLKQSKMVSDDALLSLDIKDDIDINLDVTIPMKGGKQDSKIKISFNNANYYPPGFERKTGFINHLKGDVMVHNRSINAKKLTADIMGNASEISIKTIRQSPDSKKDPDVRVSINTKTSVRKLKTFDLLPEGLNPLSAKISGSSRVNLSINLPNTQRPLTVNINTDLKGISSSLPPPLAKKAAQVVPVKITYAEIMQSSQARKSINTARFNMQYSDFVSLALLLELSEQEFVLLKGNAVLEGGQAKLPKNKVLKISGSLTKVPLEQWQTVFASLPPAPVKKSTTKKAFIPVELAMSKVVLPELAKETESKDKTAGRTTSSFDPRQFPLVNGKIKSLKTGTTDLGQLSIQSSRIKQGIVLDLLSLQGELFSFEANGKWHRLRKQPEVALNFELKVPSMENFFQKMGYEEVMHEGNANFSGRGNWAGAPSDFNKNRIKGHLFLNVKNGAFLEVKPGAAGRLLGLLNMNALARRISLDFSDVSDKGYNFDEIEGNFRLDTGNAYTDDLRVLAPSARVLVTGRIGMQAEDFDQRVTVIPEVSATLPIAGAVVAGPAGAAVVWIGQKLLGEQLNKVTAFNYTVKGSWHNPVIKRDRTNKGTLTDLKKLLDQDIDKPGSDKKSDQKSDQQINTNPIFDSY